ncbi:MAG: glycosyltransferase [Candidatus Bathyarchaeia archaeon]
MKIAVVTLYPPKKAGSAFYSFNLYRELAKYFEVVILTDEKGNSKMIETIKAWNRNSILLPFQLFKKISQTKPSIVHFQIEYRTFNDNASLSTLNALLATILTRNLNVKLIITLHGVISSAVIEKENVHSFSKLFTRILLTLFYRTLGTFSTKLVVHTKITKQVLQEEYKINPDKIVVIPHGVNHATIKRRRSSGKMVRVLFHGFVRAEKGLESLLRAISIVAVSHRNVKLTIAGGSPHQERMTGTRYIEKLNKMVQTLQIEGHVEFIPGFLSEDKLEEQILSSDIMVFPYTDQFLEASGAAARVMDYGKPIICTRTPRFIGDFEDQKDCLMITPNNEKELAKAIIALIENDTLRERISENLKKKATNRYWNVLVKEYVRLFKGEKNENSVLSTH